jgi:hypothetical protein
MTCETSIELLPWLLNGTLEQPEKDQLVQHLAGCERCRTALAESRDTYRLFTTHVGSEDLVAYVWDQPATLAAEVIERHLAGCAPCAAEAELARMSRRLEEDANVVPFPTRQVVKRPALVWRTAALAASVLLVVSATGWWQSAQTSRSLTAQPEAVPTQDPETPDQSQAQEALTRLQDQLREYEKRQGELAESLETAQAAVGGLKDQVARLSEPQDDTWIGNLQPGVYRGGEPEESLSRHQAASLTLEAQGPDTPRELTIVDPAGNTLWKSSNRLERDDLGFYPTITLPPGYFKLPGRYTLQLWSVENGERVPRESYTLTVK